MKTMDLSAFTGVNRRLPKRFFSLRSLGAESSAAAIGVKLIRLDMIIAAIAEANDCVVVTENKRDFDGIGIVNPLRTN